MFNNREFELNRPVKVIVTSPSCLFYNTTLGKAERWMPHGAVIEMISAVLRPQWNEIRGWIQFPGSHPYSYVIRSTNVRLFVNTKRLWDASNRVGNIPG